MQALLQADWLYALGSALLGSLLQMGLLWLLYRLYAGVAKPGSTARYYSAILFLFSGAGWFLFTFMYRMVSLSQGAHAADHSFLLIPGIENTSMTWWHSVAAFITGQMPLISLAYLLGLCWFLTRYLLAYRYTVQIRKQSMQKPDAAWRVFTTQLAHHLGIKKPVQLWLSSTIKTPLTIGHLKPVILLPIACINQLSTAQLEAILLHELAHIRRGDFLVHLLVSAIETVFFFNPFVRKLAQEIKEQREYSCDDLVLQFQYDPEQYATALFKLEQFRTTSVQLALAATQGKKDLLHRIHRILSIPLQKKERLGGWASLMLAAFVIAAGFLLRPVSPAAFSNTAMPFPQAVANDFMLPVLSTKAVSTTAIPYKENTVVIESGNKTDNASDALITAPTAPLATPVSFYGNNAVAEPLKTDNPVFIEQLIARTQQGIDSIDWTAMETILKNNPLTADFDINKVKENLQSAVAEINWQQVEKQIKETIKEQQRIQRLYEVNPNAQKAIDMDMVFNEAVNNQIVAKELANKQAEFFKRHQEEYKKALQEAMKLNHSLQKKTDSLRAQPRKIIVL
jgi:beta-lactamase regulating signal transducer with metallopeptidase domain